MLAHNLALLVLVGVIPRVNLPLVAFRFVIVVKGLDPLFRRLRGSQLFDVLFSLWREQVIAKRFLLGQHIGHGVLVLRALFRTNPLVGILYRYVAH